MCGIIGYINSEYKGNFLSILNHRGPDDSGRITYKNVEFGHLRLSILDTSHAGHQPMLLEDESLAIVFNGEIYNHLKLRDILKKNEYTFSSGSDTETLLKGWDYWGKDILNKLNGIFSFSILDKRSEKITVVRDQYVIKPLYVYKKDKFFAFSSEIKAFTEMNNFDDQLNVNTFSQYLSFLWSAGKATPYKYVHKLLPGHCLEVPLSDPSNYIEKKYFQLPFEGKYENKKSEPELIDELDDILRSAVNRQLLSDVPLGFFLSGGLDSSLIVGIARDLYSDQKFDCFTIDSKMDSASEGFTDDLPYAKKVAEYLDIDLHVIPAQYDIVNQFDHMIWHLDEPQADPAPINVYNISKGARELGIKVLLGGTAGDDLFSGYRRHKALKYDKLIDLVPSHVRKWLQTAFKSLPSDKSFNRRLQKLSRDWHKPIDERMLGYFNWLPNDNFVYKLLQPEIFSDNKGHSPYNYFNRLLKSQNGNLSQLDKLLYLEISTFLVDHNLNYTDKMSMAASVEVRVPFLDNEVVNFAGRLPTNYKIKNGETKYILKKVAERYLPKEVIYRSKTGFGAPIRSWIKSDLKPMINERLDYDHLKEQGIFDPDEVQKIIQQNDNDEFDYSYTIWSILAIQSWLKQFKWSL